MIGQLARKGSAFGVGLLVVACLLGAAPASAQEVASIIGQIKDSAGGVVPGVTVTATSTALQVGELNTISDANGEYRLSPLPLGVYHVTYTLAGFTTLKREDIRLTAGFVAKLDVAMNVGALSETVTVSGQAPIVDVTSTSTSTQVTREVLEIIPTARASISSLLATAPGVRGLIDIGGATALAVPAFRAFGQSGENWTSLEGVTSTMARAGSTGNYFDVAPVQEANVKTVGANADMPFRGIQLDQISKSGGNQFHGSAYHTWANNSFVSNNVSRELQAVGIRQAADLIVRRDSSADVGGRIVRDRLWFYAGLTRNLHDAGVLDCLQEDGTTPCHRRQTGEYETYKLSYQMMGSTRWIGFYQHGVKNDLTGTSALIPWESRWQQDHDMLTAKIEAQQVIGQSFVVSAQAGRWYYQGPYHGFTGKTATIETTTGLRSGAHFGDQVGQWGGGYLWHHKANGTLYKPDLFRGNHEFKFGADFVASDLARNNWPSSIQSVEHGVDFAAPDYQLQFTNNVPTQMSIKNSPVEPDSLSHYLGTYIQDNWVIGRRVTLNLGLRYARDNAFVPEQCRQASPSFPTLFPAQCWQKVQFNVYNSLAPRLHTAWDVRGDGKTVVKGGWSRFDERRALEPEVTAANAQLFQLWLFRWRDLNGNRAYDPGEVDLNPNGPDYLSTTPLANGVPNPAGDKQQKSDEFMVSLERQVMTNTAVRVTGIYSRNFNTKALDNPLRPYSAYSIPVTSRDPGPDGVLNSADDPGTNVTYFDYASSLRGARFDRAMPINVADLDSDFVSYELALSRRMANRWMYQASYSSTKINQPAPRLSAYNPNSFINVADSGTEWSAKLSGSYQLPREVTLSALYEARSGAYWTRNVLARGGTSITQLQVNVEPANARQLPTVTHLDFRADKRFRLPNGMSFSVRMNVYNALNASTVTAVNARSGPSFGRPTAISAARVADVGATFSF